MANLFEETHHKTYGHRGHDNIIELVNLRLVANGLSIRPRVPDVLEFEREADVIAKQRPVWFGPEVGMHPTKVMGRSALSVSALRGPMMVSESDTAIVVPPTFVTRDKWFNIVLTQYDPRSPMLRNQLC
jgi:N-methylhydantoinase A/oxoprolinase/acetone carboxylase beta subunit